MDRLKTYLDMDGREMIGYGLLALPVLCGYAVSLWALIGYGAAAGRAIIRYFA